MEPRKPTPVYCLVPQALADELQAPLRAHYADDPEVEVIVDRRGGKQRSTAAGGANGDGRGAADRRRPVVPRDFASELPPELAVHAGELRWEQRLHPVRRRLQDATLDSLLGLVAAGDGDAYSELCWRYAHRVRARLARRFEDPRELEAAIKQVFGRVFDELTSADSADRPLDALIDAAVDAVGRADAGAHFTSG